MIKGLYEKQKEAYDAAFAAFYSERSVQFSVGPSGGKSIVAGAIVEKLVSKSKRTIWVSRRTGSVPWSVLPIITNLPYHRLATQLVGDVQIDKDAYYVLDHFGTRKEDLVVFDELRKHTSNILILSEYSSPVFRPLDEHLEIRDNPWKWNPFLAGK